VLHCNGRLKSTNRVDNVVVTRQHVINTHVSQIVFVDEAKTTDIDTKEDAVLTTTASNRQLLQLSHHLVHKIIQLTIPAPVHAISG